MSQEFKKFLNPNNPTQERDVGKEFLSESELLEELYRPIRLKAFDRIKKEFKMWCVDRFKSDILNETESSLSLSIGKQEFLVSLVESNELSFAINDTIITENSRILGITYERDSQKVVDIQVDLTTPKRALLKIRGV